MYRLVPCIPILRVFFLLKVQKGCVYVNMLFLVLILFKICVFICENVISNIFGLDRCKTYYFQISILSYFGNRKI